MTISTRIQELRKSPTFINSVWGLSSNLFQNVLLSLFFVVIARKFGTAEFAEFLIATTLYQIIAAFSTLGLGQWFIREYLVQADKKLLISKYLKLQFLLGLLFYLICVLVSYLLYDGAMIRVLSLILGLNVVFDNLIFAIRDLNTAGFQQKKTFIVFLIDAFLRFLIGASLFLYPFSITILASAIILVRFATLNLFIRLGVSHIVSIGSIIAARISRKDVAVMLRSNWSFVVIGSISVIYWRTASVVISKMLTNVDVANYEISFKVFLLAQLVPLILGSTVFPSLVKLYDQGDKAAFAAFYRKFFLNYAAFGLLCYTFIYSFAGLIIPLAFGEHYRDTAQYTREMFLTILVFPTVFLQANVLVAMKMEKSDMWINLICLSAYLLMAFVGLQFFKSLSTINYAIFASFVMIHAMQDRILIGKGISNLRYTLTIYLSIGLSVAVYGWCTTFVSPFLLFPGFWILLIFSTFILRSKQQLKYAS